MESNNCLWRIHLGPSAKDVKHLRRKTNTHTHTHKHEKGRKIGRDVMSEGNMMLCDQTNENKKATIHTHTQKKTSWLIQTTNSTSSKNRVTSWRRIYLKHSMLLLMLIVSLLVQPLNWQNKQPQMLSLNKTRTYWCFYYFTFNLSTAKFCSRLVHSLQPKSGT